MAILSKAEIASLTVEERFDLVDRIYESFRAAPVEPEPPDWHRGALDEILDEQERNPQPGIPWEEVRAGLEKKWLR